MVKCWVSHLELYKEENLGVMKDHGKYYQMALVEGARYGNPENGSEDLEDSAI